MKRTESEKNGDAWMSVIGPVTTLNGLEKLIDRLQPHGKGGKLKTNPPTDGIDFYIWRMVRYYGGLDSKLPIGATTPLANELTKRTGRRFSIILQSNGEYEVLNALHTVIIRVMQHLGLEKVKQ